MAEDQAARKSSKAKAKTRGRAAGKNKEARKGKNKKKKNPLVAAARKQYLEQLRSSGISDEQAKEKVKAHMKDVVRPAMSEAKKNPEAKKLKGADRRNFVQNAVRSKLGLNAQ